MFYYNNKVFLGLKELQKTILKVIIINYYKQMPFSTLIIIIIKCPLTHNSSFSYK